MSQSGASAGIDAVAERHRSAAIDALRAVAALSVLAFHAGALPSAPAPASGAGQAVYHNLDAGLVLFFVISGYLISGPFVRALLSGAPLPDVRRYGLRRLARILPAFWVALLVVALLLPTAATGNGAQAPTQWWQIPVHGLLLQNVVPGQLQTMLKVDWTLENELLFYLLVPLGALLVASRMRRPVRAETLSLLVLGIWTASALAVFAADQMTLYTDSSAIARYTLPSVLALFCPGILMAIASSPQGMQAGGVPAMVNALLRWRLLSLALVAALCVAGVAIWKAGTVGATGPVIIDLRWQPFAAAFGLLLGLAVTSGHRVHTVTRLLAPFGLVSYGVYLWHTIAIRVVVAAGGGFGAASLGRLALPLNVLTVAALTIPAATASWLFIERPALRWATTAGRRVAGLAPARLGGR